MKAKVDTAEMQLARLQATHLETDGKLIECQHNLEMERGASNIYLNTLALIAKLLGVDEDDEDVITPVETLVAERSALLEQLKDTVSAWEKGDDVFGGIERARKTIAMAESA